MTYNGRVPVTEAKEPELEQVAAPEPEEQQVEVQIEQPVAARRQPKPEPVEPPVEVTVEPARSAEDISRVIAARTHPRDVYEGDPLYREFKWAGTPAWECRYPRMFHGPKDSGSRWALACCMTFWSREALADHVAIEHRRDLDEDSK